MSYLSSDERQNLGLHFSNDRLRACVSESRPRLPPSAAIAALAAQFGSPGRPGAPNGGGDRAVGFGMGPRARPGRNPSRAARPAACGALRAGVGAAGHGAGAGEDSDGT